VYLLVFHAYINEMHGSRRKIPSKKLRPYIYDKLLALLGAPYIYDISRLRVKQFFTMQMDSVLYEVRSESLGIVHKAEKQHIKWRLYQSVSPSVTSHQRLTFWTNLIQI
jgi:hypothetical protein